MVLASCSSCCCCWLLCCTRHSALQCAAASLRMLFYEHVQQRLAAGVANLLGWFLDSSAAVLAETGWRVEPAWPHAAVVHHAAMQPACKRTFNTHSQQCVCMHHTAAADACVPAHLLSSSVLTSLLLLSTACYIIRLGTSVVTSLADTIYHCLA